LRQHWIASVIVASASMSSATCRALLAQVDEVVAAVRATPSTAGAADFDREAIAPAGVSA
jgi:hypothetical protein